MELHEKLRILRTSHGMTQDELAQKLLITRQSVYKWETGRALPDIEKIKQICVLFGVSSDDLLDIRQTDTVHNAEDIYRSSQGEQPNIVKKNNKRIYFVLILLALCAVLVTNIVIHWHSAETRQAIEIGIVPETIQNRVQDSVSERDFLSMLIKVSQLETDTDNPMLVSALSTATNEQLSREKAAYWLYCTHIWTTVDSTADLSIGNHGAIDPITQRDVYQELNSISKSSVDALQQPWEWSLCKELEEVGKLFETYDGTQEMDAEINSILNGAYYTAIVFCTAEKSFLSEKPLMENSNESFLPKEKITYQEAIAAAYRLYGSW